MFLTDLSRSSISCRVAMSTLRGAYLLLVDGDGNAGGVVRQCRSVCRCVGTYLHVRWDFEKFWSVVMTNHNTKIFLGSPSSQPTSTTTLPAMTAPAAVINATAGKYLLTMPFTRPLTMLIATTLSGEDKDDGRDLSVDNGNGSGRHHADPNHYPHRWQRRPAPPLPLSMTKTTTAAVSTLTMSSIAHH